MEVWIDTPEEFTNATVIDNGSSVIVNAGESGTTICVSSANGGASYYHVESGVSNYTFTTSVRPLYVTITKNGHIPYSAVTGGNFTTNETWFGNLNVLGSVTVTGTGSLTILPGTLVKMNGYQGIGVYDNARLIAEGTIESPIVFTSATGTSAQSWNRLYIRTDNNILSHCEVKYSNWGIHMYGYPSSGNMIANCDIHDNDQGIRLENNNAVISNCDIHDNRHNIVTVANTGIDMEGTHIYDGGRDGIYSYSVDLLNLYGCVIENNGLGGISTRNGIYAGYTNQINLGGTGATYWQGLNTVRENYSSEIYAAYGTDDISLYFSSIHDDSGYEIYNTGSAYIHAPVCWWGESDPDFSQFYGAINIPIWMEDQPAWEGQTATGLFSKNSVMPGESPGEMIFRLKRTISENTRSNQADSALTALFGILRKDYYKDEYGERSQFYDFLERLYEKNRDYNIGKRALQYMIVWNILDNDIILAISNSLEAKDLLADTDRKGLLGNLIYLLGKDSKFSEAEKYLEEFKNDYGENSNDIEFLSESLESLKEMYEEEIKLSKSNKKDAGNKNDTEIPESYALYPAYPNPFNPVTTIAYDLPEKSDVTLAIFNIQGQEIYRQEWQKQSAGHHSFQWNGSRHPSGVYFIRLSTPDFTQTRKMSYLK